MQSHPDGSWSDSIDTDGHHTTKHNYRFFLLKPRNSAKEPKRLVPLEATENLASLLPGQEIVEYPTICVWPVGVFIGEEYVIGESFKNNSSTKRKASTLGDNGSSGKVSAELGNEEEDFQVMDQDTSDDSTSSSGSDSDMSE
jgi:hypothetical protein